MGFITQKYLSKDKMLDIFIVPNGNNYHISIYSCTTNKSVCYDANNAELKRLADFIYLTLIKRIIYRFKKQLLYVFYKSLRCISLIQ